MRYHHTISGYKPTDSQIEFCLISISGKVPIDPKTSYHLNDIFEYPDRVTVSTESGDVLQSR